MSLCTILAIALAALPPAAGPTSRFRPIPAEDGTSPATKPAAEAPSATRPLPYSHGRRFATLDAYLAFRREQGAIDLPWYEEVEPGIFLLRTSRRPPPPPQRFTRAELAHKFGFDHP